MNKTTLPLLALATLLALPAAAALELDRLEESLETLQACEYDNTHGVDLNWVERQIGLASVETTARPRVEEKLVEALSKAETHDAKQFLCRQLRTVGTARCVPPLAAMLTDADLSHMARYALGRIPAPEAGAALYQALVHTSGKLQAGIINTLVQIDYTAAADDIVKLAGDSDPDVAVAAIRGSGRLGGRKVLPLLQGMRTSATTTIQVELDAAILRIAQRLVDSGDTRAALSIYQAYYRGRYPEHLRTAGLRGLVEINGSNAGNILVEAIKGDDADLRRNAIAMMALAGDRKTTETFVALSKEVAPDGQELIIRSLAARGDDSVAPALVEFAGSAHEPVRLAALEALGDVGTAQTLASLAQVAASSSPAERRVARSSLARIRGDGLNEAFIRLAQSGEASQRLEVIQALGLRMDPGPFPALHTLAQTDEEATIRRAAVLSMARIGKPSDLETLIHLAVNPKHPGDRGAIRQALAILSNKIEDPDAQAAPVLAALPTAPGEAKVLLLGLLPTPATAEALAAIRAAIDSPDSQVSDAAIRALGEWPTPSPLELLHATASTSPNPTHQILALRGYIRLAPLAQDPTACYVRALDLAERSEEIRQILGGLHFAGTRRALDIAESYMNNPDFRAEAYMAAVNVAAVYGWEDRERVQVLLNRIVEEAPNDGIRSQAQAVLETMDRYRNVIASWRGTQVFTLPGIADGNRVFQTVFAPEKNVRADGIRWRMVVPAFEGGGKLDLEKTYGKTDHCCVYLRTTIHSPVDQEAKLTWRVDDNIKGWLNGHPTRAGLIRLNQGANSFVVKVGDNGGGWSFVCEIVDPDGAPLEGLRFER